MRQWRVELAVVGGGYTGARDVGLSTSRCTGRLDHSKHLTVWMNLLKGVKWRERHIASNMYSARQVM